MAVSMNLIGNYSAYGLNNAKSNKTNIKNAVAQSESINPDEKKFFAEMYPAKQNEIMEFMDFCSYQNICCLRIFWNLFEKVSVHISSHLLLVLFTKIEDAST